MSLPHLYWFHCGRCGSLFQSPAGDMADRLCPKCGAAPGLGLVESPLDPVPPGADPAPNAKPKAELPGRPGKRVGKKRKYRYFMVKLCAGWLLVLALIVAVAHKFWNQQAPSSPPVETTTAGASTVTNEDLAFIHSVGPKCVETLSGFLAAGTPEARNQFVLSPVATAARMARFYSMSPMPNIDAETLSMGVNAVLNLPTGKAIETCWNSPDGKKLEAVFREESGEWRLDWDHFARYGDYPWSLFLAGSGPAEGEFRLLARERLADARKQAAAISLVLYAPRFAHPGETGFQSPEFLIPRNTRDGQLLDAAFQLARRGGQVFDSKLPNLNPQGMIRVRVKVRRFESDLERKFAIVEVLACHWYAVADPGVTPAAPTEDPPAEGK